MHLSCHSAFAMELTLALEIYHKAAKFSVRTHNLHQLGLDSPFGAITR